MPAFQVAAYLTDAMVNNLEFSPEERASSLVIELQQEIALRKRLQEKLAFLQDYNELLVESSGDCILLVNGAGMLRSINKRALQFFGVKSTESIQGTHWVRLFPGLDPIPRLSHAEPPEAFQASSRPPHGPLQYWTFSFGSLGSAAASDHFLIVARNITEHMLAEKALRQSEEAFRKIFEENPMGMLLAGLDYRVTKVNNALCAMLGFSAKAMAGKELASLLAENQAGIDPEKMDSVIRGESRSFQSELIFQTCRKKPVWVHLTTSVLRDTEGFPISILQMVQNINERKLSEQQLLDYQEQLQSLASELSLSEERERRQIATNLHDRIGQSLAFARLKLASLNAEVTHPALPEIRQLVEQAIIDTRSLTFDLSPPVLYELGLVAAIEWLARKIQAEHKIPTRFHDDCQPKPLDDNFRIVLFQAVRELLVNVVKHARASQTQVLLRREGDALRIIIEDDGVGFEPARMHAQRELHKSFGLFNVRERLEYLGGQMKVHSEPGRGTRVSLMAPLKLDEGAK